MDRGASATDGMSLMTEIESTRLVYGAMLVGERLTLVECIEEDRFTDNEPKATLYTALNTVGADLVPMVTGADEPAADLPVSAAPYLSDSFEAPRLTSFQRVSATLPDARAYYLLVNTAGGRWKRLQNTVPDEFGDDEELSDPSLARTVVATALVEDARPRFANLPEGVDADDVGLVNWDE